MLKTWFSVIFLTQLSSLLAVSQSKTLSFASVSEGGKTYEAEGTLMDDKGTLVTIALVGSDPTKATIKNTKGEVMNLKLVIHDPVSRITILDLPESERDGVGVVNMIGDSTILEPGDAVITNITRRNEVSRVVSHVKRHNGKILPLTFVKINHPVGLQKAGTPVLNSKDELVAFVFQKDSSDRTMFALPVEVLTNVKRFVTKGVGAYKPCWIGVSMDHLNDAPVIIGVRPDSPAKKAGLLKYDVVLSIGGKKVADYPAVVNAFYYLQAGSPTEFKILRGTKLMNLNVIPEVNPLYK
ncbi:MAG: serine protease Do [Cryomorphaceae bacterium]|jgi:serine protease Do